MIRIAVNDSRLTSIIQLKKYKLHTRCVAGTCYSEPNSEFALRLRKSLPTFPRAADFAFIVFLGIRLLLFWHWKIVLTRLK